MAIDTEAIETVYNKLSGLTKKTVQELMDTNALSEAQRANIISSTMTSLLQTSAQIVLEAPLKDAQIAQATAQTNAIISDQSIKATASVKDNAVKDAQIAQATAQTNAIISDQSIKATSSTKDNEVKEAQKTLIVDQQATEKSKKALTDRQKDFYNDQGRIKKAEVLGSTVGMYAAGGTTIPTDLSTSLLNSINAITQ